MSEHTDQTEHEQPNGTTTPTEPLGDDWIGSLPPDSPAAIYHREAKATADETQGELEELRDDLEVCSGPDRDRLRLIGLAGLLNDSVGGAEGDPLYNILYAAKSAVAVARAAIQAPDDYVDEDAIDSMLYGVTLKLAAAIELLGRERMARRLEKSGVES